MVAAGRAKGPQTGVEAAQSKRLRAMGLKFGATTDEETRAWLQDRLATFSKVLFWSFAALVGFLIVMYAWWGWQPRHQDLIYGTAALSLAILAFIWRVVLLRGERTIQLLNRIDLVIVVGSGVTFGVIAPLASDLHASSYTCLLYESFVVFTRALLVPSSARRTLIVSTLAFVPIFLGAVALVILTENGYGKPLEIPGVAFLGGDILYNAVAVLLAVQGSRIIYELRQKTAEVTQLGVYTLTHKIGGGGMGEVYEAKHAVLRRPTAVKLIRPDKVGADNLDRFEREVQHTSQLTHPNTIAIFDYGRSHDGVLYYAMEYLAGIDLEHLVRLRTGELGYGPQPVDRVVKILAQVASALAEAHDNNLIHRDIKPANVILCQRGGIPDFVKVVDFGLVKELTRDANASQQVIGTPNYMAPEMFSEPDNVHAAADVYALGAVGYFLLTGKTVHEGATAAVVISKQLTEKPRPFAAVTERAIPGEVEAVIMKCLEKSPNDRWSSASALAAALEALPSAGDWTTEQAREWWKEFRKRRREAPSHDAPTETMQIDLKQRSPTGA